MSLFPQRYFLIEHTVYRAEALMLENNHYVYFGPTVNTMINFDSVPCNVSTESSAYFEAQVAWALQKDSPYRQLFNYYLTKLKENGQLQKLEVKYISKAKQISCAETDAKPIEFQVSLNKE